VGDIDFFRVISAAAENSNKFQKTQAFEMLQNIFVCRILGVQVQSTNKKTKQI
jgi:hypothetical protein